jgi:undecaprenyl-diphosphatase
LLLDEIFICYSNGMPHAGSRGAVTLAVARKRILAALALFSMSFFLGLGAVTGNDFIWHFDNVVRGAIHAQVFPSLTWTMRQATLIGSAPVVTVVTLVAISCFLLRRLSRPALLLAADMGVAIGMNTSLKDVFHRHRPDAYFGMPLPHSYSYPSGHALFAVCCYGMLAVLVATRLSNPAKAVLLVAGGILTATIGYSRIYLGVHYPTDVLGGWAFGVSWICVLLLFDERTVANADAVAEITTPRVID